MRVLVPVDGSDNALRALEFALDKLHPLSPDAVELHLLNVQPSLHLGDVRGFVSAAAIEAWQGEQAATALKDAKALLAKRAAAYTEHVCVGQAGPTIATFAHERGCDLVVMGNRGLGGMVNVLLGSATQEVLEHCTVPVVLIR
jgi:nucleotide-binding universal stress UspA family protein